jgi:ABC-type nitrate/sulfonate/bicarbonate transport system substrate-binding protein
MILKKTRSFFSKRSPGSKKQKRNWDSPKKTIAIFSVAVFMIWASLAFNRTALALDKVVMGDTASLGSIVSRVGLEKGYFKEQGIDLSQVFGRRGSDAVKSAAAGKVQFGLCTSSPFLAGVSRGAPLVMVGLGFHGFSGKLIASKKYSHLKTLQDFKGKRIGIQRGTGVHTVFLMALENLGMKESDFVISNLRVRDMPGAMQGGSFDAVLGWEPNMMRIVSMGYGKEVIGIKQFEKMAEITYVYGLFTVRSVYEKQKDLVQRFLNAWAKSQDYVWKNRKESLGILKAQLDAVRKYSDADLEKLVYAYQFDRTALSDADFKDIQNFRDFMFSVGYLKSKPDMGQVIDNSFALKAEKLIRQK